MKKLRYALLGTVLAVFLMTGCYYLFKNMGLSRIAAGIVAIIIFSIGLYFAIYYQKLQNPHCEQCDKKLKLVSKTKTSQDEEVRNGKFVFINTYDYEYSCQNCKSNIKISKKVKMK